MNTESRDMNRDPITGEPGSHPVGTGVGAAGGATAGAIIGSLFGPIGTLIGGAIGAVGGGVAGHDVAEGIDPTGEANYWQGTYTSRPYYDKAYTYDDYAPAYAYGNTVRSQYAGRAWDASLENDIKAGWEATKAKSRLTWEQAKGAVHDAFDRSDRTVKVYNATDKYYADRYNKTDYYNPAYQQSDYTSAYRYGAYARSHYANRPWDASMESELERGWDSFKGQSKMAWADAKAAVRDAFQGAHDAVVAAANTVANPPAR